MEEVEGRVKMAKINTTAKCHIGTLGEDQLLGILQYLPVKSILAIGMTCRKFRELMESEALWAWICRREWGPSAVQEWLSVGDQKLGWKGIYRQMRILNCVHCRHLTQTQGGGEAVPSARASQSLNVVSSTLVLFGGRHLDDTWTAPVPDHLADGIRWQQVKSGIPSGRFGQSCTVVGDLLVLFGGINDNGERLNDTWIGQVLYDETSVGRISWKLLEVATTPARRGAHAGCFAGNNRIVVYGGIGPDGLRLNDTWMLDLTEGRQPCWQEIETLLSPPPRSGHTLTWIGGNRMVLFGGRGTHFEVLNDVWMFDMEGNYPEWVELCPYVPNPLDGIPTPRSGHSATPVFGGRVLIYGGEDASRCRKGDIWIFDPLAGNFVDSPASFTSNADITVPDKMENSLAHKMWRKLKQKGSPPKERSFHGACAVDSGRSIIIFGGMIDGELQPAAAVALSFDAELYLLELVP
uniref:TSA: Wollemia nobilis Ref_Wollemi_Transcript_1584_1925 transcribed RNA sequence n=1 Tax=Wollemia nobilis TaxID=56998 RepID=A0A0C9SAW8_9CONI